MTVSPVSVIIPVHNAAEFLEETLNSVSHMPRCGEVLVVDDASSDESLLVAASATNIFQGRLSILPSLLPVPAGPSSTRNRGAAHAQSDYLLFLDADDLYHGGQFDDPRFAPLDQGADLALGSIRRIKEENGRRQVFQKSHAACIGSYVIRHDTFDGVGGFDESLWLGEDLDFFLRLQQQGCRMIRRPDVVLLYRQHSASATHRAADALRRGQLDAARKSIERFRQRPAT